MDVRKIAISVCVTGALSLSAYSAAASWTWLNPNPQGNNLGNVATDGTRFVAVGDAGTLLRSTNGNDWQVVRTNVSDLLRNVIWTGSRFVAVGMRGTIITSSDGLNWEYAQRSRMYSHLYAIANNGATVVVAGSSGYFAVSTDHGLTWQAASNPPATARWFNGMIWNGSRFVAVGSGGTVVRSADGHNWSAPVQIGGHEDASLEAIAFHDGRYVVVGERQPTGDGHIPTLLTSTDASTWEPANIPSGYGSTNFHDAEWIDGQFVVTGDGGALLTSSDGVTFVAAERPTSLRLSGIMSNGSTRVAVGHFGTLLSRALPDGEWVEHRSGTAEHLHGAVVGDGRLVVAGNGGLLVGDAGSNAAPEATGPTVRLNGVTFGNSTFVAVGANGTVVFGDGTGFNSEASGTGAELNGIAAGNGHFVAVGNGGTTIAGEPGSWSVGTAGSANLNAIAFGNGRFVAVGDEGRAQSSGDGGATWTASAPAEAALLAVTFTGSEFIAVGARGTVLTSSDGTDWVAHTSGTDVTLRSVSAGAGRILAAGDEGVLLSSRDGRSWGTQFSRTGNRLNGVFVDGNTAFLIGQGGTILASHCPCAVDDYFETDQDRALTITEAELLANDEGEPLVIIAVDDESARGGTITSNGDGSYTYTPPNGFYGEDQFTYTLDNGENGNIGRVFITVHQAGSGRGGSGSSGGGAFGVLSLLAGLLLALAGGRRRG